MSHSPTTQKDLAKVLGLTQASISLALRNHPRISECVRKMVQETAKEMGYIYNPTAVELSHFKRNSTLKPIRAALAWLNLYSNPPELYAHKEFYYYRQGARECSEKFGYHLDEFNLLEMPPARLEKILLARGIRGILLSPADKSPYLENFNWGLFSIVRFGRTLADFRANCVTADQLGNALLAYDAARTRGYQRIGWLTAKNNLHFRPHFHEAGMLVAQWEASAEQKIPLLVLQNNSSGIDKNAIKRWMDRYKPDAIISDFEKITELLRASGYRVPDDIAVAGTTVLDMDTSAGIDQHPALIGKTAALMLLSQISDNAFGIPPISLQTLIPGKWVDGASLPQRNAIVRKESEIDSCTSI